MARNEIQRLYLGSEAEPVAASNVEAGSYTLTLGAETTASISYNDDTAAVQAALEALSNIGAGNVDVTAETDGFTIEFISDLANQPIDELVITPTGMKQKADTVTVDIVQEGIADDPTDVDVSMHTAAVAPVQEVQRITFTGTPDSGSWTINGVTVSGGASAGNLDVENAIQDSGGFNKGCSVTGNFADNFVITFDTPESLSEIVVDTSSLLDSGSSPVTNDVTTDTEGFQGTHQKTEITFSNIPDSGSVTLSNSVVIEFTDNASDIANAWYTGVIVTGSIASGSVIVEYAYDDYSGHTIPTVSTNTMVVTGQPHIVTVELSDEPTEGQWEMNAGSNSTMFLDWDATSSEVETEFEGMAYGYPVTVTGDAGGPWTIESDDNVTATIEAQEGDGGQPLRKSVGVEIVTVQEGEPLPDAPSGLTATAISSSRIDLEWVDESDNETGFRVEKSLAGEDDWSLVGITAANATSRSVTGLTSATEYDFRVRAFNDNDASEWSDIATAQTLPSSSSTYDPILFEQCIKIPIPS